MTPSLLRASALLGLLFVLPLTAAARPLQLSELDDLGTWLDCLDACDAGPALDAQTCRRICGASEAFWEKDGVVPVTRNDWRLAQLELADGGSGTELCYRNGGDIVVPAALCPGALCQQTQACSATDCAASPDTRPARCLDLVCAARPARTAEDCADVASDGVPAWIKRHAGIAPTTSTTTCSTDASCGFRHACGYNANLSVPSCLPRNCGATACTAFHLELVSSDDQQAIVHVFYDYSPVPAKVLDLRIAYDREKLLLEDARPLPNLSSFGEQLAVEHSSAGVLRLTVWNPASNDVIRTGPIVELIFQRTAQGAASVAFSKNNNDQKAAVAPLQGDATRQGDLADDALWGPAVSVPSTADVDGDRLLLWYGFESAADPVSYRNVPDATRLCSQVPQCALETDAEQRAKLHTRLDLLQAGSVSAPARVDGVTRDGAYLDGASDHVELPVQVLDPLVAANQSFSYAMWFYSEGNTANEAAGEPQLLYSHNGADERTRFGLLLDPASSGSTATLSFFVGDLLATRRIARTTMAAGVALRTWHHAGFSLDAATGDVQLYFDGTSTGSLRLPTVPAAISCPAFANGSDVLLHAEGDFLGGAPPESIWFAARSNGKYSVSKTDPDELQRREIVSDAVSSSQDIDVSPTLGLIAYSSNASGQSEIWIADLDGHNPRQATAGFGDASRGISARRPRWAPDGSGLVFESNIYSIPNEHNTGRGHQLYFIGFDAVTRVIAAELDGGVKARQLDYSALLATQGIGAVQLTDSGGNSQNAWWVGGRSALAPRGSVLFDSSDALFRGHLVKRIDIPSNLRDASSTTVSRLGAAGEELRLLSAYRRARPGATPPETVEVLYEKGTISYPPATQFVAAFAESSTQATVTVRYAPSGLAASCWDANRNKACDTSEDFDADGACTTTDCRLSEIRNLYVAYDPAVYEPLVEPADVATAAAGSVEEALGKPLGLTAQDTDSGSFVRVEVRSPTDAVPLPPGLVARVKFKRKNTDAPSIAFAVRERLHDARPFVIDLAAPAAAWPVDLAGLLDEVLAGVFSPDGTRMLLYGTSESRPELVRSANLRTLAGGLRVGQKPRDVRGLSWVREERYFPCNWVGAYRHPATKRFEKALRGGIDDVKMWAGVRVPGAFRSEAARGLERLGVQGRSGPVASRLPACGTANSDCPAFHVCVQSQCVMSACDPADPYACATTGGRCQARPSSVEQQRPGFDFVCNSDCESDRQCFTESCLNGPCRFCDGRTRSCTECRNSAQDYGTFRIATVEGCPDSNSFRCESGACVTECYASRDGQTVPLCDPTLEYCSLGRCVLRDWDWEDFAPGSFSGLSETIYDVLPNGVRRSVAIGEMTPVAIKAYGVEDRGIPPELLVEGRFAGQGAALYGGDWFRIGKVEVHNRTQREADEHPYVLHVPHPLTALRMRMIQSPYANLDAASTGLGGLDKDFCRDDHARYVAAGGSASSFECERRPPGSVHWLGYGASLPDYYSAAACVARGGSGCPDLSDPLRRFVSGGYPAVIVTEAEVDGASTTISTNRACSYEGTTVPEEPGTGRRRKLFYGNVNVERSPEQAAFCAAGGCTATGLIDFAPVTGGAYGLLNCNYNDGNGALASIELLVPPYIQPTTSGAITETANSCYVELDQNRRELCYEYMGGNASVDPLNDDLEVFRTLEFSVPKGFAHDRGYTSVPVPAFPLTVTARGLTGSLAVKNRTETVTLTTGQASATFPKKLPVGRRFALTVGAQPAASSGTFCVPDAASAVGTMSTGPRTAYVICSQVVALGGTLSGLPGDRVALRLTTSNFVSNGRVGSNGRFDVDLTADGAFTFPVGLLEGVAWSVQVVGQPRAPAAECIVTPALGIVPAGGSKEINIRCEPILPRKLGGQVRGLPASTRVELTNSATGEVLGVSGGSFVFTRPVNPGRTWSVTVSKQPGPAAHCEVSTGTGTMPNRDVTNVLVDCSATPTYSVPVEVLGLFGQGLELQLNGGDPLALADRQGAFPTRLVDGASYEVTISHQPILPEQNCQVFGGSGTVLAADVEGVRIVCANQPPSTGFSVGGVVTGAAGPGLRLQNRGADLVEINSTGRFVFPTRLRAGDAYDVTVKSPPKNPVARCWVTNGSGTMGSADETHVQVTCDPAATLTLRVAAVGPAPLGIRAALVHKTSKAVVARTRTDAVVPETGGDITLVDLGLVDDQRELTPAVLAGGTYALYLLLNTNQTADDQQRSLWDLGDKGLVRDVTLVAGQAAVQTFALADFGATTVSRVLMSGGPVKPAVQAQAKCYWSHPAPARIPLPPRRETPVVARAELTCPAGAAENTCWGATGSGYTDVNEPLPPGTYDLTCWIDRGRNGDVADGVLGIADLVGYKANVAIGIGPFIWPFNFLPTIVPMVAP